MGMELYCECDQCGYTFGASVGFGLAYPWVYSQTIKKMRLTKSPFENLVFGLSAPEIQYSTEVMLCL